MAEYDDLSNNVFYVMQRQSEIEMRLETLRFLLESKGVFSHDEFLEALTVIQQRWQEQNEAARRLASPESLRSLLDKHEGEPQ